MANNPQKSKDATEEALLPFRKLLNVRATETGPGPARQQRRRLARDTPGPDLFPQDASQAWPLGESTPRRAANDDRVDIGQILQTLRHRSSRTPYIAAAIGGFIWIVGGLAIASLYGAELRSAFPASGFGLAAIVALATVLIVPAIFFSARAYVHPCPGHACRR